MEMRQPHGILDAAFPNSVLSAISGTAIEIQPYTLCGHGPYPEVSMRKETHVSNSTVEMAINTIEVILQA